MYFTEGLHRFAKLQPRPLFSPLFLQDY